MHVYPGGKHLVGRIWVLPEQRDGRHDHAGLAITALRDSSVQPSLLNGMQRAVPRKTLDRSDRSTFGLANRQDAARRCCAIEMHRTNSASADAAAIFCSGEPQLLPQN